jgi:integrase
MAKYKAGEWPDWRRLLNNVLVKFGRLCKAANVPRCAFHSLRKSFCTNLLEGGVAPHAVQQIMGHASLETTIKYYSKVRRDQIAAASRVAELSVTGKGRPQSVEARLARTA